MAQQPLRNILQGGLYMRADKGIYPDISPILMQITVLEDYALEAWYDGGDHWFIVVTKV